MDKQIIIDGYNLEYIKELLYNGQRSAISTNIFETIIEELERKEQECDMWKNLTVDNGAVALKYQQQLDQFKAELEQEKNWHKTSDEISKANSEYTAKLKQTLTEIKEIASPYNDMSGNCVIVNCFEDMYKILQKISECEVENV